MRLSDFIHNPDYFLDRLRLIYKDMADTYAAVSTQYGDFGCEGCQENCCRTRFYNHTYVEYFYLMEGLAGVSAEKQAAIRDRAEVVCLEVAAAEADGITPRVMCPLNNDGLCGDYEHRLMICRLHGLPYELRTPGRQPFRGEGCMIFTDASKDKAYVPFDRTPFYQAMAGLEQELRATLGASHKFKKTIAEMIVQPPEMPPLPPKKDRL